MTDVDPFVIKWPTAWERDPEIGPVIHYLNRFLHDLWVRTGGGDDAIAEVQIGELYETGIESATVTELEHDLNDYDFEPQQEHESEEEQLVFTEVEDQEEPWQPEYQRVWDKRRISSNTYASDYSMLSVSRAKTVYLPEYPDINSEIVVINEDGSGITVDGNNNKIKVRATTDNKVNWSSAGQSINFYWFEDGPWWVAI